jgi:hypothetical protein
VARIGPQLPLWFQVERKNSVGTDGWMLRRFLQISSHDTAVSLPAPANVNADHADTDPVKGTRVAGQWTPEEDAKLNSAVMKYRKKKSGKEYRTDWASVAALFPYGTKSKCRNRWRFVLDPTMNQSN